jgi:hypothetical protein
MRQLPKGILALLGVLALVGAGMHEATAQADKGTGTEMLAACRAFLEGSKLLERANQEQTLRARFCAGYVLGIIAEETEACVSALPVREAVRAVVEYLETHSDDLDKPFDDLVERALISTWPCKP